MSARPEQSPRVFVQTTREQLKRASGYEVSSQGFSVETAVKTRRGAFAPENGVIKASKAPPDNEFEEGGLVGTLAERVAAKENTAGSTGSLAKSQFPLGEPSDLKQLHRASF